MRLNFRVFFPLAGLVIVMGLGFSHASAVPTVSDAVTITLNAPAFERDSTGGLSLPIMTSSTTQPTVDGAQASPREPVYSTDVAEGQPVLPHRLVTLILPPDADLKSLALEVSGVQEEQAPGQYQVPLAQPKVLACAPPVASSLSCTNSAMASDLKSYLLTAPLKLAQPAGSAAIAAATRSSPVTLMPYGQMRKWKLANLDYQPFSYDSATGKLTVIRQVTVRVTFRRDPALLDRTLLSDSVLDDLAPRAADNYAEAKPWYDAALAGLGGPLQTGSSDNDYVIITTDAIYQNSNIGAYMTFLREHGHVVTTLTTSRYGGKTGAALANAMRTELQNLYPTWGIRYVLLVGNPDPDKGDVPMRMMYPDRLTNPNPTNDNPQNQVPTDLYYADLQGNWDLNNDGFPGEAANLTLGWAGDFDSGGVSFTPTLFVGRIPVYDSDYAALNAILQKLMNYQSVVGWPSWRNQALLANSFWGPNYDGAVLGDLINQDFLNPNSISSYRIYSYFPQPTYGSCVHSQISTLPHEANLGNQVLQNRWASNPAGLMVWSGHGNVAVTVAGFGYSYTDAYNVKHEVDCWHDDVFNSNQAAALNDAMPAFTFHNSCLNGYPEDKTNIGYTLLRNGAVSTVSASRETWLDSSGETHDNLPTTYTSAADKAYHYVQELMNEEPAGMALSWAAHFWPIKADTNAQNNFDFNLYGDPAMGYYVAPFYGALSNPGALAGELIDVVGTPSFYLTWKDYSNRETYYRITLTPHDDSGNKIIDVERDRVTATFPTPACGKTYDIIVQAGNGSNLSGASNMITLASQVCPPQAPANLYAAIVNGQIQLSWDNVAGETGYNIYRRTKAGQYYMIPFNVGTTGADVTTFTDTSAACYKTYSYTVEAYNDSGTSGSSPAVLINSPMCAPPAPSDLGFTAAQTSVTLTWTDNSNGANNSEAGFEIWQMPSGGSWSKIWTVLANTTSYIVTGLACSDPDSSYKVAAYNNGGRSESGVILAKPEACTKPAAPTNFAVDDMVSYPNSLLLGWDDNSDNEWGFKIEQQNGSSWNLVATLGPDENVKQVAGLTCAASYTFRIYAFNGAGNSNPPHATTSGTTAACDTNVPINFQGSGEADGIHLSWDVTRGQVVTSFDLERSSYGGRSMGWSPLVTVNGLARSYTDTGAVCGHFYYYHVRAVRNYGAIYTSAYTPALRVFAAPCPPGAPSAVGALADSASSIVISWRPPLTRGAVDGYNIYHLAPGPLSTWKKIGSTTAGDLNFTDTRLRCGSSYNYRVAAFNTGGEGSYATTSAATVECPPTAPSDLARTEASLTGLALSWTDNSANEDGFILQRFDLLNGWVDIATTAAGVNTATDSGLTCGTLYSYRVLAFNAGGQSTPSAELDTAPRMCAITLKARAGQQGLVRLTWTDPSSLPATHYFQRRDTPGGLWIDIGNADPKETVFRDLSAPCGQTLSYRARGSSDYSEGPWSDPVSISTTCAPTTVITLTTGATTIHSIALQWTATAGGQTGFVLERSIDGINAWSQVATPDVKATSYTDLNLPPGTLYYYRLRAVNAGGDAYSTVVFGQTKFSVMLPLIRK